MDNKLIFLLVGVVIVIIGVSLSLNFQPGFDNNESIDTESDNSNLVADNQFKEAQFIFYNSDASVAWYLESSIINNYTQKNILELTSIEIDAKRDTLKGNIFNGQLIYQLIANDALYNINTGQIEINGPINIVKDQIKVQTNKLNWQDGKSTLVATEGVSIESPYFSLKGEEMKADLALNDIVIKGKGKNQAFFTWPKGSDSN